MHSSLARALFLVRRVAIAVLAVVGAGLLIAFYTPLVDWVTDPLLVRADRTPSDAIVLLTAWSSGDRMLSDSGIRRTVEAAQLYHAGIAPMIVISGHNRSEGSGPTAEVMCELLIELGVPKRATMLETISSDTHESAIEVMKIARARDWKSLTVVTDARHARRAVMSYGGAITVRSGTDIRPALRTPAGVGRLTHVQSAMHEWLGVFYYRWMGWI